ncbi:hypothetical protein SAMN05446037_100991 [Anaerovirgula multivorans]|uniref:Coat F domain-containing protein n=1 Tax=Anaerovirgula multivorans TaxID=312168 RepID=A0A239E6R8_9FIRM|nr:hypothetical protein [Anaerovirgula multivorans]SNS40139.1 hypothetical protein SAMN05446037_100991 [Anaerovirgula multivorans]
MKNIATKELNYLKDFLSWELLSAKKSYEYAQQETDQHRKQIFLDTASIHQQNYMNLLNYANQVNTGQSNMNWMNNNQGGQMN